MNLDYLYMIPLSFGNDILPKFIHFFFALLTAWILYRYTKKRVNHNYGLLCALFFLSIPIIIKLSITAYVDLGLILFSTASLLLLFEWSKNNKLPQLLLAGICCGLAVGTKYNGLISLLLLTAFVPLLYNRYNSTQSHRKTLSSFKYGSIFFTCALIACSPWLIRNFLWVGNPLYPLFDSFFNPQNSANTTSGGLGIFTFRELVYGETPLQMLLLPFRIFFEGQDNIPKLFDGKLTPFLLILPAFSFLPFNSNKEERLEKLFLALFAILFFFFSLFTTVLRIRYIGPIIPPLVILSIFGLRNMCFFIRNHLTQKKLVAFITSIFIFTIFTPNIYYLYQQFQVVQPFEYLSGKIDRDGYLTKHRSEYATIMYANQHLPKNTKILCIYLSGRSYYFDRPTLFEPRYGNTFFTLIKEHPLVDALSYLQREKIGFILVRDKMLLQTIRNIKNAEHKNKWYAFFHSSVHNLYSRNGYSLYAVRFPAT